jgi:hypothetical protein
MHASPGDVDQVPSPPVGRCIGKSAPKGRWTPLARRHVPDRASGPSAALRVRPGSITESGLEIVSQMPRKPPSLS